MELTKTAPDPEIDTPSPTQPHNTKSSLSFTNGALKRHHHQIAPPPLPSAAVAPVSVSYKECLKNHAASLGGHAVDGCGEFMPSPTATATDPTSLKCAACGCHRNFHRRDPEESFITTTLFHHIHHHPPPPHPPLHPPRRSSNSTSSASPSPSPSPPPPPSSSYYSSAPHMLLALSTGVSGPSDDNNHYNHHHPNPINPTAAMKNENVVPGNGRKRFRTKFSPEQKEKMYGFAEKLEWKMQRSNEGLVEEFCNEIGIGKSVLKVWMHNNKHTLGKRCINYSNGNGNNNNNNGDARNISFDTSNGHHSNGNNDNHDHHNEEVTTSAHLHVSTNGSSSSS